MATIQQINSWFETGDIPTQEQFQQTFSSFVHKGENIEINKVAGLENELNDKLSSSHNTDENSHINLLAKLDASNLNYENTEAWRSALRVGNIPDNVAIVDERESQEVYSKSQIQNITMLVADFLADGKIRADKIEALGLTDLIEVSENSLEDFVKNTSKYNFQQNDFIAIPVNKNYSLFIFKGGDRNVAANYLPTGLANITVTMVEGLQAILNSKLDKPVENGNYFVNMSGNPTYKSINPGINSLLFWDGSDFKNSSVYRGNDGLKYGIGTTAPSEQLHLTSRARMSALVLEDVPETLPQQITYNNRKFFGTDSTGLKRQFMFADHNDFLLLANSLTDDQKNIWKTSMNGGWTTAAMSVAIISPLVIDRTQDLVSWVSLKGANLNLNPASFSIELMDEDGTAVVALIPSQNIQLYQNGLDLTFYYNFSKLPEGNYRLRLWNGVAYYTTNSNISLRVVDKFINIDTASLTWDVFGVPENTNTYTSGSGNIAKIKEEVSSTANITTPVINIKSSPLHDVGDNFYIELDINISHTTRQGDTLGTLAPARIGVTYSDFDIANSVFNTISYLAYKPYSGVSQGAINKTIGFTNITFQDVPTSTFSTRITLIKNGNILYTIWSNNNQIYQIDVDNSKVLSIIAQFPNWEYGINNAADIIISKAYKF